ncbi:MAG: hypothetical protein R3A10_03765 [Caldilineaceae bacterium]
MFQAAGHGRRRPTGRLLGAGCLPQLIGRPPQLTNIKLIDTLTPLRKAGTFDIYPFYTPRELIGGAWQGAPTTCRPSGLPALRSHYKDVPDDLVYNALAAVFSEEGLAQMASPPRRGRDEHRGGITGIPVALHPTAPYRFWQEHGIEIPENLVPTE